MTTASSGEYVNSENTSEQCLSDTRVPQDTSINLAQNSDTSSRQNVDQKANLYESTTLTLLNCIAGKTKISAKYPFPPIYQDEDRGVNPDNCLDSQPELTPVVDMLKTASWQVLEKHGVLGLLEHPQLAPIIQLGLFRRLTNSTSQTEFEKLVRKLKQIVLQPKNSNGLRYASLRLLDNLAVNCDRIIDGKILANQSARSLFSGSEPEQLIAEATEPKLNFRFRTFLAYCGASSSYSEELRSKLEKIVHSGISIRKTLLVESLRLISSGKHEKATKLRDSNTIIALTALARSEERSSFNTVFKAATSKFVVSLAVQQRAINVLASMIEVNPYASMRMEGFLYQLVQDPEKQQQLNGFLNELQARYYDRTPKSVKALLQNVKARLGEGTELSASGQAFAAAYQTLVTD